MLYLQWNRIGKNNRAVGGWRNIIRKTISKVPILHNTLDRPSSVQSPTRLLISILEPRLEMDFILFITRIFLIFSSILFSDLPKAEKYKNEGIFQNETKEAFAGMGQVVISDEIET